MTAIMSHTVQDFLTVQHSAPVLNGGSSIVLSLLYAGKYRSLSHTVQSSLMQT